MFEIHSKNTYEEFMRAQQAIAEARVSFYKTPQKSRSGLCILLALCALFEGMCIYFAIANNSEWFSAFSVFLGLIIVVYIYVIFTAKDRAKNAYRTKQAEKELYDIWNSDKQLKGCDETVRFDEDGFEVIRSFGSFKVGYDCVFRLAETQTNLYILLSLTRFVNIKKDNLTKEQYDFIKSHCRTGEDTPADR